MENTERRIAEAVQALVFDEGAKVELRDVHKNNGVILRQLQINNGERIQPSITIDDYIIQAETGRNIDEIAQEIVENNKKSMEIAKSFRNIELNYENVLNHTKACLVNYENNKDMLEKIPHRQFLDLAVIYRCFLDVNISFIITNDAMELLDTNQNELWEAAEANADEYECKSVSEFIRKKIGVYVPDEPLYFFTNKLKLYGSSVMLGTEPFRGLAKRFNSDLYIIPSSIHEVLAIPISELPDTEVEDMEGLRALVGIVNNNDVEEQEVLSSNVYLYSLDNDEISIA